MSVEEVVTVPTPSIFVLGPSLSNVIEPIPVVTPVAPIVPGRRTIAFHPTTPTTPGGNVHLQVQPPLTPSDVLPVNVYAFFHQPVAAVPTGTDLVPDWFFKNALVNGSIHIGAADAEGNLTVTVTGVKPSLQPYHVQTVLEFTGS